MGGQESLRDVLAQHQDMPDRLAAALIALVNGDNDGAAAVLADADPRLLLDQVMRLCTLTCRDIYDPAAVVPLVMTMFVQLGLARYGRRRFVTVLRRWADDIRALDPHTYLRDRKEGR